MNNTPTQPRLLPEALYRGGTLFFCHSVPLALLLGFNIFVLWLLNTEMSSDQQGTLYWVCGVNVLFLLGATFWGARCVKTKKEVSLKYCIGAFVTQVGYLYLITSSTQDIIPRDAAMWMVQPERWMGLQYTLIMPGLFYSALRLACFPMKGSTKKELGVSISLAVGIPISFYLVILLVDKVRWHSWGRGDAVSEAFFSFLGFCFVLFAIGVTIIALVAILRSLALLYRTSMAKKENLFVLTFVSALVAPIAGLLLNRGIPFPADFQHSAVYVMTVVNALILLIPASNSLNGRRVLWFLLWFSFPFTLYFFLVFLPWLPLSLFAMIAAGAGFLILAPTLLMIIHCLKIRQVAEGMRRGTALLLALFALSLIPTGWTLRAISHRNVLEAGIQYAFQPGLETPAPFSYKPAVLKSALGNLHEHYEGKYIPYLTDLYDSLVFNGMTLPKTKMEYMHQIFFGEPLPDLSNTGGLWGMSRNDRMRSRVRLGAPPSKDAVLQDVIWTQSVTNGMVELEAELFMHNPTDRQVEYEVEFDLPPGVWVNGYWLDIEGEEVPGMLVERKTAEWIYRMIRDATRRDPGLLRYMDRDTLELRVFPFEAKQSRRTGIRFTYPVETTAQFSIGKFSAPENPQPSKNDAVAVTAGEYDYFGFSRSRLQTFDAHVRKPYLHLLIDSDLLDVSESNNRLTQVLAAIPETWKPLLKDGRITLLDYEAEELSSAPVAISQWAELIKGNGSKSRSGFFPERGITHALRIYQQGLRDESAEKNVTRYPIVCIVSDKTISKEYPANLDPWLKNIPEWQEPWIFMQGKWVEEPAAPVARPVALLKHGESCAAVPVSTSWAEWWSPRSFTALEVADAAGTFHAVEVERATPEPSMVMPHEAWAVYRDYVIYGATETSLRDVIESSRESSTLLPSSSYIVLENEAQWKMLKLKEKQKLSGADELELYKTSPEPSSLLLMLFGAGLIFHHQRKRSRIGA